MQTKIQKWGNSLGLRIPKIIAEEAGVYAGSEVELTLEDGDLIVRPVRLPRYDLDQLLAQVTDDNIHDEIDSGAPMGKESW